ncbi:hypothetical protein L1O03_08295 [Corynebacterium uropygiale]|uniref:Uncharacterized protein n=1 Tax=Corynebacterium uropygiale TaxID=1775911 RepID=A0A9X1QR05_9CORY|nr:hypothetical protein [Corynebacterium uropygiale]MCF4007171.1 hypothetical protein [Corynebacterium uropygiale]
MILACLLLIFSPWVIIGGYAVFFGWYPGAGGNYGKMGLTRDERGTVAIAVNTCGLPVDTITLQQREVTQTRYLVDRVSGYVEIPVEGVWDYRVDVNPDSSLYRGFPQGGDHSPENFSGTEIRGFQRTLWRELTGYGPTYFVNPAWYPKRISELDADISSEWVVVGSKPPSLAAEGTRPDGLVQKVSREDFMACTDTYRGVWLR